MSNNQSMMAADDEEFVRETMYIMFVWTIAVIVAGIALVLLRDPFTGVFALTGVL
ncbi:hypothetical protein ACLI4Z_02100 [Natrialbaceae archaeon A-arb3/5]